MLSRAVLLAVVTQLGITQAADSTTGARGAVIQDASEDDKVGLIQRQALHRAAYKAAGDVAGQRDLVLMHVPYNFGHTVEEVAMFGDGPARLLKMAGYVLSLGLEDVHRQATWEEANLLKRENGEVWGHLSPDLQVPNEVTGCATYYTPPKYWPKELAEKYFGNKTIFGLLRDPYERLVAFFRGNLDGYGGSYPEFIESCDVNGAVKQMMKDFLASGDNFTQACSFIPQAEYFEGPYGISLPVDNRQFPESMNKVFREHGYRDFQIQTKDILHVKLCPDVWSGDLDAETRSLVKRVYARDFELLCKHFGYCDRDEDCCIWQVPDMCPAKLMAQGYKGRPLNATTPAAAL